MALNDPVSSVDMSPVSDEIARLRARIEALERGLRDAIRALEVGRIPRGGDFLGDLRTLLSTTKESDDG